MLVNLVGMLALVAVAACAGFILEKRGRRSDSLAAANPVRGWTTRHALNALFRKARSAGPREDTAVFRSRNDPRAALIRSHRSGVTTPSPAAYTRALQGEHQLVRGSLALPPLERVILSLLAQHPWTHEGEHAIPWEACHIYLTTNHILVVGASGFADIEPALEYYIDLDRLDSFELISEWQRMLEVTKTVESMKELLIGTTVNTGEPAKSDFGDFAPWWLFTSNDEIDVRRFGRNPDTDRTLILSPLVKQPYQLDSINEFARVVGERVASPRT
ncbi:MAG: hypothetical protein ACJ71T_01385 [Actinomycetales bacterium]